MENDLDFGLEESTEEVEKSTEEVEESKKGKKKNKQEDNEVVTFITI